MANKNAFKNAGGKYYTRQLFWEEWVELPIEKRSIEPMFTLYTEKEGLINFGKAYVDTEDPSGYTVSQQLLDGYRLWSVLLDCTWFKAAKKLWDEEMDARLSSKGLKKMQELLKDGSPPQQAVAAKYFADKEYRRDKVNTRGRPSKAQINQKASEAASASRQLAEDYDRIKVVNLK